MPSDRRIKRWVPKGSEALETTPSFYDKKIQYLIEVTEVDPCSQTQSSEIQKLKRLKSYILRDPNSLTFSSKAKCQIFRGVVRKTLFLLHLSMIQEMSGIKVIRVLI